MARILELEPHKFGEIEFETVGISGCRGISNSDVLPEFRLKENRIIVIKTIEEKGSKISNRKGFGWVHTNFPCKVAEKARQKLAEATKTRQEAEFKIPYPERDTNEEIMKLRKVEGKLQKKMCPNHSAQYGCSKPCEKCIDFSKDGSVAKIQGSIFFRNGYGANSLEFLYFAVIKHVEGVPMLYVRRRPAKKEMLEMSAEQYQKEYVSKNKHVKNSFCVCLYTPRQPVEVERALEITQVATTPESGVVAV